MIIIKSQAGGTFEYLGFEPQFKQRFIRAVLITGKGICVGEYETEERTREVAAKMNHHVAAMYNDVNNQMNPIFTMPEK